MDIATMLAVMSAADALVEAWRVGGVCAAWVHFGRLPELVQQSAPVQFVMEMLYLDSGRCRSA